MNISITIPGLKETMQQGVRDVVLLNIGTAWVDYCELNQVDFQIEDEVIKFLEDFANKINEPTGNDKT